MGVLWLYSPVLGGGGGLLHGGDGSVAGVVVEEARLIGPRNWAIGGAPAGLGAEDADIVVSTRTRPYAWPPSLWARGARPSSRRAGGGWLPRCFDPESWRYQASTWDPGRVSGLGVRAHCCLQCCLSAGGVKSPDRWGGVRGGAIDTILSPHCKPQVLGINPPDGRLPPGRGVYSLCHVVVDRGVVCRAGRVGRRFK